MARVEIQVNVSWREIPLFSDVNISEADQRGGFLGTDSPLPVGTMLILSPVSSDDLRVPARVVSVTESRASSRGRDPGNPGMQMTFEALGEQLIEALDADLAPADEDDEAVEMEAAPADEDEGEEAVEMEAAPADEDEGEETVEMEAAPADEAVEMEAEAPDEGGATVEMEAEPAGPGPAMNMESNHTVGNEAVLVSVSGEINLMEMQKKVSEADPDAPDKVIVEVEKPLATSKKNRKRRGKKKRKKKR